MLHLVIIVLPLSVILCMLRNPHCTGSAWRWCASAAYWCTCWALQNIDARRSISNCMIHVTVRRFLHWPVMGMLPCSDLRFPLLGPISCPSCPGQQLLSECTSAGLPSTSTGPLVGGVKSVYVYHNMRHVHTALDTLISKNTVK
jgi:hypothetical protein